MSRVGKKPIAIPDKVKIKIEGKKVFVEGPKGKLNLVLPSSISAELKDKELILGRSSEEANITALHGMARAMVNNMVTGVSTGFTRILEIVGVGYKAEAKGKEILLALGYSHPVEFPLPEGIEAKVEKQTRITISGCDKQLVGEVAAKIRKLRAPEPYKGKGIRYAGETIKLKVGKAAATASS